jgi:hypothetical protein
MDKRLDIKIPCSLKKNPFFKGVVKFDSLA